MVKIEGDGLKLRIFISENDRWQGKLLYEAIVRMAREDGLAGATVLRGMLGFGADSRMHSSKILRLSDDLPVVVEIVDREERIKPFLEKLDGMVEEGMIALEPTHIIAYRHKASKKS